MAGINWRNLAATALLSTSKHQASSSVGPGVMRSCSALGISGANAVNRAADCSAIVISRASVGELWVASSSVSAVLRRLCSIGDCMCN